jgi:hypothetical protein
MDRAALKAEGLGFADDSDIQSAFEIVYATPLFTGKVGIKFNK